MKYDDSQYRCLAYSYYSYYLGTRFRRDDADVAKVRRTRIGETAKIILLDSRARGFLQFFFFVSLMKINYMIKIDAVFRAAFNL